MSLFKQLNERVIKYKTTYERLMLCGVAAVDKVYITANGPSIKITYIAIDYLPSVDFELQISEENSKDIPTLKEALLNKVETEVVPALLENRPALEANIFCMYAGMGSVYDIDERSVLYLDEEDEASEEFKEYLRCLKNYYVNMLKNEDDAIFNEVGADAISNFKNQ